MCGGCYSLPIVKLFSVNVKNDTKKEYYCKNVCLIGIINELESQIPGIKKELINNSNFNRSYNIMVEEEGDSEINTRLVKEIDERVNKNARLTIFPVITGG